MEKDHSLEIMFNKTKVKYEAERRRRQELEDQIYAQRLNESFQQEQMQRAQQNALAAQQRQNRLQQERMQQAQQDELAARERENRLQQERMQQAQQNELAARERERRLHQEQMLQAQQDELAAQERENRLHQERMQQAHEREMQENLRNLAITAAAHEELKRREEERQMLEYLKEERERKRLDDEERERQNRQKKFLEASPETLRNLRDLIRLKYKLDIEIWGLRGARKPDRWIVEQKMEQADAVLAEVMEMVQLWEHQSDGAWDDAEWERVQDICSRLQAGGIRIWADNPVWNEVQDGGGYRGGSGAHRRRTRV